MNCALDIDLSTWAMITSMEGGFEKATGAAVFRQANVVLPQTIVVSNGASPVVVLSRSTSMLITRPVVALFERSLAAGHSTSPTQNLCATVLHRTAFGNAEVQVAFSCC